MGVDLFFVLSGFLITDILLRTKGSSTYLRSFFCRRALRILPLCYLTLAALLVVVPLLPFEKASVFAGLAQHQTWFWTHLSNIHFARHGFTGDPTDVYWSLAVEEQFYLVWPFIIALLSLKRLRIFCVALIIGVTGLRIGLVVGGVRPDAIYALTVTRMDTLAWGALLACQVRSPEQWGNGFVWLRPAGITAFLMIGVVGFLRGGLDFLDPVVQAVVYTLAAIVFAAIVAQALQNGPAISFVVDRRWLRVLGKYSFALYLIHLPVRSVLWNIGLSVDRLALGNSPWIGQILFSTCIIGISFLASWLSWRLIEAPILSLKRYFPYGQLSDKPTASQQSSDAALISKRRVV